jgi:hypothetical protein
MAFLGALLFLALWSAATKPRSKHIFWVALILLAMPQFHMSGLMLIPTVAAVLWLAGARVSVRWLVAGLLAGLVLYVPYVRGEMANGWQNTHGMMAGGGGHSWDGLKALTLPINLLLNWVPQWNRTFADYKQFGRACFGGFPVLVVLNLLSVGVGVFLAAGAFLQIRAAMRGFWAAPRRAWQSAPGPLFLMVLIVIPLFFVLVSGKPFHARYGLVLMAPILVLAGSAAARWTASARLGKQFRVALIALVLVNVWFMPAFYYHQQTRIEQGENFVASFRQLELVYQQIKAHAGPGRPVRVDITAYIQGFPRSDEVHREAGMIRRYVEVREKEAGVRLSEGQSPSTYELLRSNQVTAGNLRIAYQAHGIALVGPVATPNVK